MWNFTWQKIRNEWTPSKECIRICRLITLRATVQINIVTKCLKVAMQQGTRLSNFSCSAWTMSVNQPLAKGVAKHSWGTTKTAQCGRNAEYKWSHSRQTRVWSAFSTEWKCCLGHQQRDMDSRQQKHWIRQWFGVNWASECSCSCCDHQQDERAADQYWLFQGRPTLAFTADAWENTVQELCWAKHLYSTDC